MPGKTGEIRGFTLIETMIAMALLAFIVADVGMVGVYAGRSGIRARRLTDAVSLAENAIEHARSADFHRLRLADNDLARCLTGSRAAIACGNPDARIVRECFSTTLAPVACDGAGAFFTRERDVATLTGTTLDNALSAQIDVLLAWVDAQAGPQEYRLASIISKY